MYYYFSKNIKEDSYIVLGNMHGSVAIISFSSVDRGPFKQEPQRDTSFIRYESILKANNLYFMTLLFHTIFYNQQNFYISIISFFKHSMLQGEIQGLRITEFKNVHTDWVKQVAYYDSLRSFLSSSRCCSCSLLVRDLTGSRIQYKFSVKMGISCFTVCEGTCSQIDIYSHLNKHIFHSFCSETYLFRKPNISDWWIRLHNSGLESFCNKTSK